MLKERIAKGAIRKIRMKLDDEDSDYEKLLFIKQALDIAEEDYRASFAEVGESVDQDLSFEEILRSVPVIRPLVRRICITLHDAGIDYKDSVKNVFAGIDRKKEMEIRTAKGFGLKSWAVVQNVFRMAGLTA